MTLVELTVASMVMTLALTGMYGMLREYVIAEQRVSHRWQEAGSALAVCEHLAGALTQCVNLKDITTIDAKPEEGAYVLTVMTCSGSASSGGGSVAALERRRYRYRTTGGGELTAGRLRYAGDRCISAIAAEGEEKDEERLWSGVTQAVIAQGIDDLSIRFRPARDSETPWLDRWSGSAQGLLIRISVRVGSHTVERTVLPNVTATISSGGRE